MNDENAQSRGEAPRPDTTRPSVQWDDAQMASSYANVVNAGCTREEVTLFFGTNQTWKPDPENRLRVRLDNRIILNPDAARRLLMLLGSVMREYESRYGRDAAPDAPAAD